MSVAWSRFDAEVGQLKRLYAQAHVGGHVGGVSSVPAVLKAQSRRQSAANRRAIASLQMNTPSQTTLTSNMSQSATQMTDTPVRSETLPQISQRPVSEVSRPCISTAGLSTATTTSTSVDICSSNVAACRTVPQQSADVTSLERQSDSAHVAWTHQDSVDNSLHQLDASQHLIISACELGDIGAVTAVTSAAVTTVSTAPDACHGVSIDAETLHHHRQLSSQDHELSLADHHHSEGCKDCFC